LAKEGFVSVLADGRSSALSLLEAVTFDLIVISLSLLNDDPLSIIATLRASDKSHETPLLLLADFGEKERILRGFQLGVNDCVSFPIDVNELRLRCRNQIRRKFYQDRLRLDVRTALEMALTDPLTGLYNQRYLRSHLLGLIKDGRGPDISVLMIDVDHFKSINDQNGHAFGDHSLKLIAHALRVNTRVFDTVARYGGEEFVVVMPSTGFLEAADSAERLRKSVEEIKFDAVCKNQVKLTVSIGVVCNEGAFKALSAEMLLQNADKALYEAKRTGRNKVVMYVEPLASDRENI
jgi:two-component system cell cycle response regulator